MLNHTIVNVKDGKALRFFFLQLNESLRVVRVLNQEIEWGSHDKRWIIPWSINSSRLAQLSAISGQETFDLFYLTRYILCVRV